MKNRKTGLEAGARVLRARDHRRMAWKNGGGETAEIAVFPAGATVGDFGWRVSMATVASDGPFSLFAGVDRTLSVLEGEGIVLDIEGRAALTLTPASEPLRFAADARTDARLVDGTIVDLNVMTRRGRFDHRVERHSVEGALELTVGAGVLVSAGEALAVSGDGFEAELGRYDALLVERAGAVRVSGRGQLFVIALAATP